MATKRRVKKDLKRDPLVTYSLRVSQYAQEHFNQIIIGAAVLVAAVVVLVFSANSRRSSAEAAQRELGAAIAQFTQGQYETAKMSFEEIFRRRGGKDGARAKYFKAECELRLHNFDQALADFDLFLAKASEVPEFEVAGFMGRALCYEGKAEYSAAAMAMVNALEKIDDADPRYADAAFQAGEFFAKAGDNTSAATYFNSAAGKSTGPLKERASAAAALVSN